MSDSTLPDGRLRQLIARMRSARSRWQTYGGADVIYGVKVNEWADELEALLASPLHAGANLKESDETKVSGLLGDAGRGVEALLGGASQDSERRIPEIRARLDGWRDNCAEKGGNRDYVLIFEAHAADDIAWLLERCRPLHAGAEPEALRMTSERAVDWVLHLATPPRPDPSAWTDVAWVEYWREQRHQVLLLLAALSSSRTAPQEEELKAAEDHGNRIQCPFCRRWTNHFRDTECGWCSATLIRPAPEGPKP